MASQHFDAKGLLCPLPVLRARKLLAALATGDVLTVEATDPGAARDFPAFCAASGHTLRTMAEADGVLRFEIEKRG